MHTIEIRLLIQDYWYSNQTYHKENKNPPNLIVQIFRLQQEAQTKKTRLPFPITL
ncbi:MAG: hypothetical protein ACJART_001680 [Maribacter sp.]|jgi:hypothetical protein